MRLTSRAYLLGMFWGVLTFVASRPRAHAEGSFQVGINQGLRDDTALRVDILSPDEEIHIAARSNDGSPVSVLVTSPLGVQSSYALASGAGALPAQLPSSICDALVVRTGVIGVWQVQFVTTGSLPAWQRTLMPFDVTVSTPEAGCIDPRRSALGGRVHSLDFHLRALGFDRSNATNADFFVLSTASGSGNGAVWLLDFEGLAGWDYHVAASRSGLLPPYSYTSRRSSISPAPTTQGELPVYLQFPAVVDFSSDRPEVSAPPLSGLNTGIVGLGADIRFSASFATTYQVALDINQDGKFEPSQGDVSFGGTATAGENVLHWDGRLADGAEVPPRSDPIPVRITLRTGEFHFAGYDIETARPGLSVFAADGPGKLSKAQMHWDDRPVLSGDATRDPAPTYTLEDGVSSATNRHGWGDFTARDPGDNSYIDTWVTRDEASVNLTLPWLAAGNDADGDGLDNGVEHQLGTLHDRVDTDGDGASDFLESLPLDALPDSDGDGTIDALDPREHPEDSGFVEQTDAGVSDASVDAPPPGVPEQGAQKAQLETGNPTGDPSESEAPFVPPAPEGSQARAYVAKERPVIAGPAGTGDAAHTDGDSPLVVVGGALCGAVRSPPRTFDLYGIWFVLTVLVLRRRRRLMATFLSGSLFFAAHAQAESVRVDQYRAAPRAFDGFVVRNLREDPDRNLHLRLDFSYTKASLVLKAGEDEATETELISDEIRAQLSGSLRVDEFWLFYMGSDAVLAMNGQGKSELSVDGATLGDMRAGARLNLNPRTQKPLRLGLESEVTLPLSRWSDGRQHFSGDHGPTLTPALLIQVDVGGLLVGSHLGARIRRPRNLGPLSLGSELVFAAGVSGSPTDALRISLEGFGARPLLGRAARGTSPLELLLGVHLSVPNAVISGAVGTGVGEGYGAPSYRLLGSVAYVPPSDVDRDQDGIVDRADRCPAEPEDRDAFEDRDGCPDRDDDGDRVLDAHDGARLDPEDYDGFQDEDGMPDRDNDVDGVLDPDDGAPLSAEDRDGFEDADGVPDLDNDADGVLDEYDLCPRVEGLPSDRGCPSRRTRPSELPAQLPVVEFAEDSDLLLVQAAEALESMRAFLVGHPEVALVRIEGHTDSRHESGYNLELSLKRAQQVRDWLQGRGIDSTRLEVYGCGESRPVDDNQVEIGRAHNRRAELHVVLPKISLGRSTRGCIASRAQPLP